MDQARGRAIQHNILPKAWAALEQGAYFEGKSYVSDCVGVVLPLLATVRRLREALAAIAELPPDEENEYGRYDSRGLEAAREVAEKALRDG